MKLKLDYTLCQEARMELIENMDLTQFKPNQLDAIATYILHIPLKTWEKEIPSNSMPEQPNSTHYTRPRMPVRMELEELQPIAHAKSQLSQLSTNANPQSKRAYKRISIELSQDARTIEQSILKPIPTSTKYSPDTNPNIFEYIDYTNSHHIKQLILHYSKLRQSEESKWDIYHLDQIIDKSGLEPWQIHLLKRRIDGAPQPTIGGELAREFAKFLSPTHMSNTMRGIYKQIARTAAQSQTEFADKSNPLSWKKCRTCGQTLHMNKFYSGNATCKQCKKIKRQEANQC